VEFFRPFFWLFQIHARRILCTIQNT
jgi:hypothetical protein